MSKARAVLCRSQVSYAVSPSGNGGPIHLGLIGYLLFCVWLMLDATRHNGLHADSNLVRACAAHQISHASLGHRREENEDGKQGEENAAGEPWAWHLGLMVKDGVDGRAQFRAASSSAIGGA